MITFCSAFVLLVLGYLIYGRMMEIGFGADPSNPVPCDTMRDGVDYQPLPTWRIFLIQFLNIAGTGPILGAIAGILFGPAAYLWIVFGCIMAGAVHDYFAGMISLRRGGCALSELVGSQLGKQALYILRFMSLVLLVLVGAVFVMTPAGLLLTLCENWGLAAWLSSSSLYVVLCIAIFVYYFLATMLPIDKLIGKIYPLFGASLLIMAVGLLVGLFTQPGAMPEITDAFVNHHPAEGKLLFPMMFITIACGAISGFHATQSPMMARCMQNEKFGRPIFYGAMITEGLVALIWAASAIKWANGSYETLANSGTAAQVVGYICHDWMGSVGAVLAIFGVVAAPITSGDTALRSARLQLAEILNYSQNTIPRRLAIAVPLFAMSILLMFINFDVLWRYFGWANQTIAAFTLWACTIWLAARHKNYVTTLLPALFMTVVCVSFILVCPPKEGGLGLPQPMGVLCGIGAALVCLAAFVYKKANNKLQIK